MENELTYMKKIHLSGEDGMKSKQMQVKKKKSSILKQK
jgi:hypothetical protein